MEKREKERRGEKTSKCYKSRLLSPGGLVLTHLPAPH
jgi:hypothetical protein